MKRTAQPEEISPVCSGYITVIVLPITGSAGLSSSHFRKVQ